MSTPSPLQHLFHSTFGALKKRAAGLAIAGLVVFQFAVLAYVCPIQAGLVDDVSGTTLKTSPAKLDILDKRECDRHTIA